MQCRVTDFLNHNFFIYQHKQMHVLGNFIKLSRLCSSYVFYVVGLFYYRLRL
jgi:hypothetical protein